MNAKLAQVEQQARQLSAEERAVLAEHLLESLQDVQQADVEAAWQRELADRVQAYERGEMPVHAGDAVFAEAKRLAR